MNVFVSYRRDDTRDFAGRLAERLNATPEIERVFIDVDGIEPGTDFQSKIESALDQSDACLVVIGPNWLAVGPDGVARISNEGDFVRLELRRALASGRRVLPILANGATMPRPSDVPEDVRGLTRFNAVPVRHESFDRDAEFLIDAILRRRRLGNARRFFNRHPLPAALLRAAASFIAGLFILVLVLAMLNATTGKSLEQVVGGRGPMYVAVATWQLLATAVPFLVARHSRRSAR